MFPHWTIAGCLYDWRKKNSNYHQIDYAARNSGDVGTQQPEDMLLSHNVCINMDTVFQGRAPLCDVQDIYFIAMNVYGKISF